MQCERRVKKEICGGEGYPVTSESGEITWGWECLKCRKFTERCQNCGGMFRVLSAHLQRKPECTNANKAHRTIAMCNKVWAKNL